MSARREGQGEMLLFLRVVLPRPVIVIVATRPSVDTHPLPATLRRAPPGSSLWTLKLERVCMPESEWWSLGSLPLTPGAWGGGGEEKATLAV